MNLLKSISTLINHVADTRRKNQARLAFLDMSDHRLEDIGVSRYQLERGISAYPWTDNTEATTKPKQQPVKAPVIQLHAAAASIPPMESPANAADVRQAA